MVSEVLSTSVWLGLEYLVPDRQTAGRLSAGLSPRVVAGAIALLDTLKWAYCKHPGLTLWTFI